MTRKEILDLFKQKVDILMMEAEAMRIPVLMVHPEYKDGMPALAVRKLVHITEDDSNVSVALAAGVDHLGDVINEAAESKEMQHEVNKFVEVMRIKRTLERIRKESACDCPKCSAK